MLLKSCAGVIVSLLGLAAGLSVVGRYDDREHVGHGIVRHDIVVDHVLLDRDGAHRVGV